MTSEDFTLSAFFRVFSTFSIGEETDNSSPSSPSSGDE